MKIENETQFHRLIDEALSQPFSGWDLSFLRGRWKQVEPLPWDYRARVVELKEKSGSLLDIGTGGGEFLASIAPFPGLAFATESYSPNVPLARARLEPLGCRVIALESQAAMPFESDFFDLVINRHSKFIAAELARVMKPGGLFVTQQVGSQNLPELNDWLGAPSRSQHSSYQRAQEFLRVSGFSLLASKEVMARTEFYDVGAVVYFLRAVPWQIADFSVEKYFDRLAALHHKIQMDGYFAASNQRYYLEARLPDA